MTFTEILFLNFINTIIIDYNSFKFVNESVSQAGALWAKNGTAKLWLNGQVLTHVMAKIH